jgi:peptidoglycan/LPS O-acetylase OafA/YrhL
MVRFIIANKLLIGAPFAERYFSLESALFGFGLGALLYFWQHRGILSTRKDFALFVSVAWPVNFFAEGTLMPDGYSEYVGFYLNTALAGLIVISQPALRPGPLGRRIDAVLGNLSYPIFLVQWLGGFVGYLLLSSTVARGWELVLVSLPIIVILASVLAWLNKLFVDPLRWKVRNADALRNKTSVKSISLCAE